MAKGAPDCVLLGTLKQGRANNLFKLVRSSSSTLLVISCTVNFETAIKCPFWCQDLVTKAFTRSAVNLDYAGT